MTKQPEQFFEENMGLVHLVLRRYYPKAKYDEDMIQVGMIGLWKAVLNWDENKGAFSTFACQCIRNEIRLEYIKRSKHLKLRTISLEQVVYEGDNDSFTLGDALVSKDEVDYIDLPALYQILTPGQRKIFDLKREGLRNAEIARELGMCRENVGQQVRKIKHKWNMLFNED